MNRRFQRELTAAGLQTQTAPSALVTSAELSALPSVVRRYLEFMGVPGRPRTRSLSATRSVASTFADPALDADGVLAIQHLA